MKWYVRRRFREVNLTCVKVLEAGVVRGHSVGQPRMIMSQRKQLLIAEIDTVFEIIFEWFLRTFVCGRKSLLLKHFLFHF